MIKFTYMYLLIQNQTTLLYIVLHWEKHNTFTLEGSEKYNELQFSFGSSYWIIKNLTP